MAKSDLLAEAEALGIEGLDDSFTNKQIQSAIDAAQEAQDAPESDEEPISEAAEAVEEEVPSEEPPVAPEAAEATFAVAQLKPYAEQLFGVGYHVIVGAQSAGFLPAGRVTKAQVAAGIDQYLNMPVENGKEA